MQIGATLSTPSPVGYAWLAEHSGVRSFHRFKALSYIGGSRRSLPGQEIYPRQYQPAPGERAVREHLRFALAHEDLHLEFLARFFAKTDASWIVQWLTEEPSSSYARRAGFFYEWLTGRQIAQFDRVAMGNYVDAIDSTRYLAATQARQNRRWRVNDNLPGTREFCPTVRLGAELIDSASIPVGREVDGLIGQFGEELIMRSLNWLSVKESRASFQIEREADQEDRIHRFARAMTLYCGRQEDPLDLQSLAVFQDAILGQSKTTFQRGLRRSPVFVGHTQRFEPVVDYVAPHQDMVPGMLDGLREFALRTATQVGDNREGAACMRSVLRATVLSFGFVYIHPMADGNGRISRFLINDTLRRDAAVPSPLILPVSAAINASARQRDRYDRALEEVSRPLMARLQGHYSFDREHITVYDDGVRSNFKMDNWQDADAAWRYLDLSSHSTYLSDVIRSSLGEGIAEEARYLQRFDRTKAALQTLFEGRDEDFVRIIESISSNQGVSKSLRKLYPDLLEDENLASRIADAVLIDPAEDGQPPQDEQDVWFQSTPP